MRCPKCGYNSFDHLDSCKKCGKDLAEHKQKFGIVSVLFPGLMKPADSVAADDVSTGEAVAAVAAPVAAAAFAEEPVAADADSYSVVDEPAATETSEADDFGFDFMSDSEEEEDLSFDELFEEAPVDEEVEESLPSPEAADTDVDEFSFDMESSDDSSAADSTDLEDSFGFDPSALAEEADDDAGGDFDLPPADDKEFSFDNDTIEFDESDESGAGEDPKDPFDLPESAPQEEAPEQQADLTVVVPEVSSSIVEDDGDLLAAVLAEEQAALEPAPVDALLADSPLGHELEPVVPASDLLGLEPESAEETVDELLTCEAQDPEQACCRQLEAGDSVDEAEQAGSQADDMPLVVGVVGVAAAAAESTAAEFFGSSGEEGAAVPASELAESSWLPETGSRVAAFCCDLLLLVAVAVCFVMAAEAAISTSGSSFLPSLETLLDLSIPYFLVLFSLAFGYFTLFHFLAGQTPGKMLTGLRVETVAGEPLQFSQAFLRSVGGLLQVLPIGLGYLAILKSPDRRGWNDRLAGTRLISLKGLPEEA